MFKELPTKCTKKTVLNFLQLYQGVWNRVYVATTWKSSIKFYGCHHKNVDLYCVSIIKIIVFFFFFVYPVCDTVHMRNSADVYRKKKTKDAYLIEARGPCFQCLLRVLVTFSVVSLYVFYCSFIIFSVFLLSWLIFILGIWSVSFPSNLSSLDYMYPYLYYVYITFSIAVDRHYLHIVKNEINNILYFALHNLLKFSS